jgi:hypothetical protein
MNAPSAPAQQRAQPALTCAGCGVAGQAPVITPIPNIPILRLVWRPTARLLCDSCRNNNPLGEATPAAETIP